MEITNQTFLESTIIYLLKKNPFYGHMLLNMRVTYIEKWLGTAAVNITDQINIYLNPLMFNEMTIHEQSAIVEHEINHLLMEHFMRRGERTPFDFNVAADIAIDQLIVGLPNKERCIELYHKAFKELPKEFDELICGSLMPETYDLPNNLTCEEYYNLLQQNEKFKEDKAKGGTGDSVEVEIDFGDGEGKQKVRVRVSGLDDHSKWDESTNEISDELKQEKIKEWLKRVVNSMEAGDIPSHVKVAIGNLFKTQTRWREKLHRFLTRATLVTQKPSRKKLNRRFGLVYPGTATEFKLRLAVAIDESGSVSDELSTLFFSELRKINLVSPEIWMYQFDVECTEPQLFKKFKKLEREKCGGTVFVPAIKKAEELKVDALIILTDGEANLNIPKPKIPVLWALDSSNFKDFKPPFGSKIELEPEKK